MLTPVTAPATAVPISAEKLRVASLLTVASIDMPPSEPVKPKEASALCVSRVGRNGNVEASNVAPDHCTQRLFADGAGDVNEVTAAVLSGQRYRKQQN